MKNHFHHESLIDASSYYNSCLLNRCKVAISVFLLALTIAFNLWWLLLADHGPQRVYDYSDPADTYHDPSDTVSGAAPADADAAFCNSRSMGTQGCDIFKGRWVPDPSPPLYTNDTCRYIFPNQDCMTNGRPDTGFIHWKWQPNDCEIPAFDPTLFLHLMTEKKMVFVGDSLARNQMQSLLCSIAQVETPEDVLQLAEHEGLENAWRFPSYNFTLAMAWSPFLVNYTVEEGTWKIHLDRPDERWASPLADYEFAVFNSLYWFFRRSVYYVKDKSISEYDPSNVTSTEAVHAMKHVWSTVLKYLVENYRGIAILRTVSVSHFDGNPWDKGGTCYKTQPEFDPQIPLPWLHNEVRNIQNNEFTKALHLATSRNSNSSCRLKLLDVTYSTLLRPDGHPGAHRIQNPTEPRNDCAHWCMPGAIDTWNQLLFADPEIMCS